MTMNSNPQEQRNLLHQSPSTSEANQSIKPSEATNQNQMEASSSSNSLNNTLLPSKSSKNKSIKDQNKRKTRQLDHNLNDNGIVISITPEETNPERIPGYQSEPQKNWGLLIAKLLSILIILYFFVCSLGFLSDSFRLIAGKAAGEVLQKEKLLKNPIVGVMMGILVTVAVQSSSTSTSIVVSMVASGLFTVKIAIPIIMGANIGTSVTNTVVALTHMSNREDFERAFAGAVLHDMFNLLTVSSLLIVEQGTSYLEVTTTKLMDLLDLQSKKGGEIQVLSKITKPFTSLIVQIDKEVIIGWSIKDPAYDSARLLKVWCNSSSYIKEANHLSHSFVLQNLTSGVVGGGGDDNETILSLKPYSSEVGDESTGQKCKFLFNLFNLGDLSIGLILLGISLFLLCGCLILLVKVLSSLLKGKLALAVQKAVNADIPYLPCLTGYLAIGIGALMTILVQSSSVFTSALTPLIAMGMISLERAYPLTLGSNLGTTTTAMLAALATEGPNLKLSIQLALCHFLFNLTGILLFYPIPATRFPIRMAAALGKVTARYRWVAIFYLVFCFLLLPLTVFILTLLGPWAFYCVVSPILCAMCFALTLNFVQNMKPEWLPLKWRNWEAAPLWMHSLEPYDQFVEGAMTCWGRGWCWGKKGAREEGLRQNSSQARLMDGRSNSPIVYRNGFENTGYNQSWIDFTTVRQPRT